MGTTIAGCSSETDFDTLDRLVLEDQSGAPVPFPDAYAGEVVLLSFIYTSCPSICIQTTYRVGQVERALHGIPNKVRFVSITLDPKRDTASVLRDYAAVRNIDTERWSFLTGTIDQIDSVCEAADVYANRGFVEYDAEGRERYTIDQSDVVLLLNQQGDVVERYKGSEMNPSEVALRIEELTGNA